ncbi:phosphonate C-P lyase system protein PhnK (plasmid) [Thermus thermophilus]|uniref:ATP-binding cassette domain-containing protein n=1 Tax=Thermus thermophilus TaxID=274 RepID=UPI001FCD52B6|nr:ATP-binding cassette domain-containing protein [Thermus thermophilus]BDG20178.1 phosphonate C-P lyase system protein PhnK [Thermus thermophilus]BDG22736.1 phosphonate C-P lyase system protein PhnK [Thermus thermophilus]
MDRPILVARGLRKAYGSRPVLRGVDLELYPGEVVGIVGASGSGKSTLLRVLYLAEEAEGEYRLLLPGLEGQNLLALDPYAKARARRHLALVHQEAAQVLRMGFSALANVVEPVISEVKGFEPLKGLGLEALVRVDFPAGKALDPPARLSGGERQRVQLARALAQNPRVLLLDEPTTGLDLLVQAAFLDTLRRLKRETGMAMVLVSHDLGVVRAVADHILVFLEGEVVEAGLADQVLEDPQHPYTQDLVQARL